MFDTTAQIFKGPKYSEGFGGFPGLLSHLPSLREPGLQILEGKSEGEFSLVKHTRMVHKRKHIILTLTNMINHNNEK